MGDCHRLCLCYGNDLDSGMANFDGDGPYGNGRKGQDRRTTVAVGSFRPNGWGLYDMHGNVWEWCQDWGWGGSYPSGSVTDPLGPRSGDLRVYRGGSWSGTAVNCRSANRNRNEPTNRNNNNGFRVVASAQFSPLALGLYAGVFPFTDG